MDFNSLAGVKSALQIADARSAGRARNYFYVYPFDFGTVNAGASRTITAKVSAAAAFVTSAITGTLDNGSGTALADTEAWSLTIAANEGQWSMSDVPWDCLVGTAQNPFYPLFRPVCAPGASLAITVRNNSAANGRARLALIGHNLGI